jgi:hypothetical protein
MIRQDTTGRRLSVEIGFEPRRGNQEALGKAYQRLLPPSSRLVCTIPSPQVREEARHAAQLDPPDLEAGRRAGPRGHLRSGVL